MNPICPYCDKESEAVKGKDIYPFSKAPLATKDFFRCEPCDARVGTHAQTGKPLGRLANQELREAKMEAHQWFDQLWQTERMNRREAYAWLALEMGLTKDDCHIGMFDTALCSMVVALSKTKLKEVQNEDII